MKIDIGQSRIFLTTSLVTIIASALLFNSFLASQNDAKVLRGIASVDEDITSQRNPGWEHDLAQRLSQKRQVASVGKPGGSALDKLLSETHGKYAVTLDQQGKLTALSYVADQALEDARPNYTNMPDEFLAKHKALLPVNFESIKSVSSSSDGKTFQRKTFVLLDKAGQSVGEYHFEMDIHGRLLGLKFASR